MVDFTPTLHKQHGKEELMVCYYNRYHGVNVILWISLLVNSKDKVEFAMLFTLLESRKTSGPVLSRDRGNLLQLHP